MIQKNNEKKFVADVWKIIFSLTLNSMESYHPEHLLVYYTNTEQQRKRPVIIFLSYLKLEYKKSIL